MVDTFHNIVRNKISVGNFPAGIAITPDGSKLYVTNLIDNSISVISTLSQKVLTTIKLPAFVSKWKGYPKLPACSDGTKAAASDPSPSGIAVSPDGRFAYVANAYDDNLLPACQPFQPGTVTVIQTSSNAVVNTLPSSGGLMATAISFLPNSNLALVANTGTDNFPSNTIGAVDTAQQQLIGAVTEPSRVVGPAEIDPQGGLIYVPNIGTGSGGESLLVLNASSLSPVKVFALPAGSFPMSLAIVPR